MKKLILGLHIVTFTGALFCMQEDQMRKEDQQWEWSMQISQQSKMGNEAKERCNSLTIAHALNQQFRKDKSNNQLFKIPLGQRLDMITKNYLQEIAQVKEARAKGIKLGQERLLQVEPNIYSLPATVCWLSEAQTQEFMNGIIDDLMNEVTALKDINPLILAVLAEYFFSAQLKATFKKEHQPFVTLTVTEQTPSPDNPFVVKATTKAGVSQDILTRLTEFDRTYNTSLKQRLENYAPAAQKVLDLIQENSKPKTLGQKFLGLFIRQN